MSWQFARSSAKKLQLGIPAMQQLTRGISRQRVPQVCVAGLENEAKLTEKHHVSRQIGFVNVLKSIYDLSRTIAQYLDSIRFHSRCPKASQQRKPPAPYDRAALPQNRWCDEL